VLSVEGSSAPRRSARQAFIDSFRAADHNGDGRCSLGECVAAFSALGLRISSGELSDACSPSLAAQGSTALHAQGALPAAPRDLLVAALVAFVTPDPPPSTREPESEQIGFESEQMCAALRNFEIFFHRAAGSARPEEVCQTEH